MEPKGKVNNIIINIGNNNHSLFDNKEDELFFSLKSRIDLLERKIEELNGCFLQSQIKHKKKRAKYRHKKLSKDTNS